MRSTTFFAALVVVAAVTALVIARNRDDPGPAASRGTLTLVGDSLNVGVERHLAEALPAWKLVANDMVGRTTDEGIAELEAQRPVLSSRVVISLGTNDSPTDVTGFRDDVDRVLELIGPNRCVIWATIWRDGKPSDDFNAVLREAAAANRRLRIVEWAEMARTHPDWLAADGLHGSELGYRERAAAIAAAATGCAPAQSVTTP